MYTISKPTKKELKAYYREYKDIVMKKIRCVLSPDFHIERPITKKYFKVVFKRDSWARSFFLSLLNEDNLYDLLAGDVEKMIGLIKEIESHDPDFRKKISKKKYPTVNIGDAVEDFNELCRYIFIDSIYDGKENRLPVFKKHDFVVKKSLLICPYCGASEIKSLYRGSVLAFSAPIDHYFPKSKYPFLALNYYNLIPCCSKCNDCHNKGSFDPYAQEVDGLLLMNPYIFRDNAFRFLFKYAMIGHYNKSNFTANIDYLGNNHLRIGYTKGIVIEELYKHDSCMSEIWNSIQGHIADGYSYLTKKALCIEKKNSDSDEILSDDYVDEILPGVSLSNLLGFELSDENSRSTVKYKFRKDIIKQMLQLIKMH